MLVFTGAIPPVEGAPVVEVELQPRDCQEFRVRAG